MSSLYSRTIWVLIIVGSFLQGLYFERHLNIIAIGMAVLFLFALIRRDLTLPWYPIVLLPLISWVPLLSGAPISSIMDGWIRIGTYVIVGVLLMNMEKLTLRAFYSFGILLAATTILSYLNAPLISSLVLHTERFSGVFQYPNTLGAIMGGFLLVGLIQTVSKKTPNTYYWIAPLLPMMFVFLGTESRGALLVFFLGWFIVLCLFTHSQQIHFIWISGYITILTLLVRQLLSQPFVVVLILGLASWLLIFAEKRIRYTRKFNRWVLPSICVLLGIGLFLDLWKQGWIFRQLSEPLQDRILSFSLVSGTGAERFTHWKDGLTIAKDSLFFGHGYRGWERLITRYQSVPYRTQESHNGYLDLLIDFGLIGVILGVLLFSLLVYKLIQHRNEIQLSPLAFVLIVGLHSFLDFNFSFGIVVVLVIWAIVLTGAFNHQTYTQKKWKSIISFVMASIVLVLALTHTFSFMLFKQLDHSKTLSSYEAKLDTILFLDATNPLYHLKKAEYITELYTQTQTPESLNTLNALTEETSKQFSGDSKVLLELSTFQEQIANTDTSLKLIDQAIKVNRFYQDAYTSGIRISVEKATELYALDDSNYNKFLAKAETYYQTNQALYLALGEDSSNWEFSVSGESHYYMAVVNFLQRDYEEMLSHTRFVVENRKGVFQELGGALHIIALEGCGSYGEAKWYKSQVEKEYVEIDRLVEEFEGIMKNNQ